MPPTGVCATGSPKDHGIIIFPPLLGLYKLRKGNRPGGGSLPYLLLDWGGAGWGPGRVAQVKSKIGHWVSTPAAARILLYPVWQIPSYDSGFEEQIQTTQAGSWSPSLPIPILNQDPGFWTGSAIS